jgi:predicted DNA binding CopG/RHH family protein
MNRLSDEEKTILRDLKRGHYRPVSKAKKDAYTRLAKEYVKKMKAERINIRINEADLQTLKEKAVEEGLPYQTLISSILHKYVSGTLIDMKSMRRLSELKKAFKGSV